jgi:hypothetical protein
MLNNKLIDKNFYKYKDIIENNTRQIRYNIEQSKKNKDPTYNFNIYMIKFWKNNQ